MLRSITLRRGRVSTLLWRGIATSGRLTKDMRKRKESLVGWRRGREMEGREEKERGRKEDKGRRENGSEKLVLNFNCCFVEAG